jgi:hypothetical protein
MVLVVEQGINPMLKEFGFPGLQIKIGMDLGENAIVQYASNIKNSHVDIIGYPMNNPYPSSDHYVYHDRINGMWFVLDQSQNKIIQ